MSVRPLLSSGIPPHASIGQRKLNNDYEHDTGDEEEASLFQARSNVELINK